MSSEKTLRDGRYEIRGILGQGTQGTTFDALDTQAGRSVAIKRFDVRGAKSWKDVELAEREIRVLATLDHPLVARYVEHFEEGGNLFLVMEKVEGETLEAIRRRQGPLPEEEVRRFLACADSALTYLHGRAAPIVHRDVKPRNVVRRPDGSYVLVDFGAVSELLTRRERGGSTVVGTIGYMAPEQLQGRAMPQTDIYAVGATALTALTGIEAEDLPHRGLRVDVRAALGDRVARPPSPALVASLERMLEPDPDRRPASLSVALDPAPVAESPASVTASARSMTAPIANEDVAVKSIRNLLWLLWGLGWVLVPLVCGKFLGEPELIPLIMFGSLAGLFVLGWHKGALIRLALRGLMGRGTDVSPEAKRVTGRRIEIHEDQRVRVHAAEPELRREELFDRTEVDQIGSVPSRRAASPP